MMEIAYARWGIERLRAMLPHGGSLPDADWARRHRAITVVAWLTVPIIVGYGVAMRGSGVVRYAPETASLIAFAALCGPRVRSRKWRSVAASLALLTASAALVDISGGLIEMHFAFFVAVVALTVYEDWVPFLVAVGFVLLHHGVVGMLDPHAVFNRPAEWARPWEWAALHAFFVALAGVAGVSAWRLNEQVRERMLATQAELARLGETDPLTGLHNRRRLMNDLDALFEHGGEAALALFDLNGFKDYNDRFGHPAGDSLLTRLATQLCQAVGESGDAYRLGGDEFCVLAATVTQDDLESHAQRWSAAFVERGEGFAISASHGAAMIPAEAGDPSDALRLCDRRLYEDKSSGRPTAASQTKDALLATLAARHADLSSHLSSVAAAADRIGDELGIAHEERRDLRYAAELHDIGKVAIPDTIIHKPGPLDEEEWEFMRRHTVIGERILAAAPALARIGQIVRATHERWDGNGYPDGLSGEQIPLAARVIAVCDAYDAMISPRPYRPLRVPADAVLELRRCAGSQFDPEVVRAFLRVLRRVEAGPRSEVATAASD